MREADVALTPMPQAAGQTKARPVILLKQMPPFGDWLVCGVSSQLHQEAAGFDEILKLTDTDCRRSGLKVASLIRLGFLAVLPAERLLGILVSISQERHERILQRLGAFLQNKS